MWPLRAVRESSERSHCGGSGDRCRRARWLMTCSSMARRNRESGVAGARALACEFCDGLTDLTLSCAAGPPYRSRSGAAVAAHDVRRTESRTATAVTPSRLRHSSRLGRRIEAGPHQLQREVRPRTACESRRARNLRNGLPRAPSLQTDMSHGTDPGLTASAGNRLA